MYESANPTENEREPLLSELMIELDHADLTVLKRYGRFINIPTEHNFSRVLDDTRHLYHAFGQYLRKMIHGDVELDAHRVAMTATVINDIAHKHHFILADYETPHVKLGTPDWEQIHEELASDLAEAICISPQAFSDLAIDRLESLIDGEKSVLILLARGLKEKRIDLGRQALDSARDVLKVGAGTILGIAAWNRLVKRD